MNRYLKISLPATTNTRLLIRILAIGLAGGAVLLGTGCARKPDYTKDVQPILTDYCVQCHQPGGQGYEKSGLDLSTYAGVMKGTKYGQVVVPGDSMDSVLIELVEHRAAPEIHMPHDHPKLPEGKIRILSAWVDQGAKP